MQDRARRHDVVIIADVWCGFTGKRLVVQRAATWTALVCQSPPLLY